VKVKFADEGRRRGPSHLLFVLSVLLAMLGIAKGGTEISSFTSPLGVANGGTGAQSFTAHYVLVGEGTSAVTPITPSTSGRVLTSNGTGSDPTFQDLPAGSPHALLDGSVDSDTTNTSVMHKNLVVGNSTPK